MEIADFKNFEEFQVYIKQHASQMQHWSTEQIQKFTEKVLKLKETNPEFKEKYENLIAELDAKQKKPITIGGTEKETERSRAMIKLKKAQYRQKNKKMSTIEIVKHKKQYEI